MSLSLIRSRDLALSATSAATSVEEVQPLHRRQPKQAIIIRRDLGMRRGKEISQGAHASMMWLSYRLNHTSSPAGRGSEAQAAFSEAEAQWLQGLFTKITCQVPTGDDLFQLQLRAAEEGIMAYMVTDAGATEFHGTPTPTALAIGPDWEDQVDIITSGLKLY